MIDFFVRHDFKVIISLDGPHFIHDRLRINCSHDVVMNAIDKIKQSAIQKKLELNCTYTKYHADNIGYHDLVHYFDNIGVRYNISKVITDVDWLKLPENKTADIVSIDLSYERLYTNSLNISVSGYVSAVINALTNHFYYNEFCHEICYGTAFDCDGTHHPCIKLIKRCDFGEAEVVKCNSKNNVVCNECWAKGLCFHCAAKIYLKTEDPPYNLDHCFKKEIYIYICPRTISFIFT